MFLRFLSIGLTSEINAMRRQGAKNQQNILEEMEKLCQEQALSRHPSNDSEHSCPVVWDGVYCWPITPAGRTQVISCPSYIYGFNSHASASRYCTPNGTWWENEDTNDTWTNYTHCVQETSSAMNRTLIEVHIDNIKLISKIGYSLSLATLLVAFFVLAFVRKLRCPRNSLHLQLFMSFIMRAVMFLLKDGLFPDEDIIHNLFTSYDALNTDNYTASVDCKVFTSFWHYFLMANYCWILMEGLYLHNLVFLAMFTDTSSISWYLLLGWGLPLNFIIPWIIVRATLDDVLCWTTNEKNNFFWIIRGPITVSILINFVLFINITRVLFMKMFGSHNTPAGKYHYRKWFRSTLVLVPLFGVHYAILLTMSLAAELSEEVEVVWLYVEQIFSSSQGSIIAFLYCFLNGEVQSELRKLWQSKIAVQNIPSHHSLLGHSLTSYVSRGRNSVQYLSPSAAELKKEEFIA